MAANQKYKDALSAARETRYIEFKGPMAWTKSDQCSRFELLKDIAALANVGGGLLVIGRHEPDYKRGTLDERQYRSFDSTDVNQFVQQYLGPPHSCEVIRLSLGRKRTVVIEVPGFHDGPLIFQRIGNCGKCKEPHFRPADLYIRSRSNQSKRVSEPYEMRDLLEIAVGHQRSASDELLRQSINNGLARLERTVERMESFGDTDSDGAFDISKPAAPREAMSPMLGGSKQSSLAAQDLSDYASGAFWPWTPQTGHFRLVVYPIRFIENRITRRELAPTLKSLRVSITPEHGNPSTVPFVSDVEPMNYPGFAEYGDRRPAIGQYELCRLHEGGLFTLVRIFPDDYNNGMLVLDQHVLDFGAFVDTITALHFLAGNIAKTIGERGERFMIELKLDGLQHRRLVLDQSFDARAGNAGHPCSVSELVFPNQITSAQILRRYTHLAAENIAETLWNFGVDEPSLVASRQRKTRLRFE